MFKSVGVYVARNNILITQKLHNSSILFVFIVICSCKAKTLSLSAQNIRAHIPHVLHLDSGYHTTDEILDYLSYFNFPIKKFNHKMGLFSRGKDTCLAHVFTPPSPLGTVFLFHGYYDHSGLQTPLLQYLLKKKYSVALFDLPGHGISTGKKASINDFSEYAHAADMFIQSVISHVSQPYFIMGHSTGCAVALEYIYTCKVPEIKQLIFCAPLVRSAYWHISLFARILVTPFVKKTTRWFRTLSHDKVFLNHRNNDPLQVDYFPLIWANAHKIWFDRVKNYSQSSLPLKVIQGTGDNVVDWRYNMKFLKSKFLNIEIRTIEQAKHHIMNESPKFLQQFYHIIDTIFAESNIE